MRKVKNGPGNDRRALIVIIGCVVALIVSVWLLIMTGALAFLLDPDVESLDSIPQTSRVVVKFPGETSLPPRSSGSAPVRPYAVGRLPPDVAGRAF